MSHSVIIDARRSPVGKYLGSLSKIPAPELGSRVAKTIIEDNAAAQAIDEVFIGCVLQAGLGQNPARQVALGAGLGHEIAATTFNKVCGSGLEAVIQADRAIRCGDVSVALCGGIESMSQVPYYVKGARMGLKFGDGKFVDGMLADGLTCAWEKWAMGCAAEETASKHDITREQQDAFAIQSHHRAGRAQQEGLFSPEIVAIETKDGLFDTDETVRPQANMERVAKLPPAFDKSGTVTAGNASALSDGAAMMLVASAEAAATRGWTPRAEILATVTAGLAPRELFIAPVHAVRAVVERAGLGIEDIDLFEINEAFASQTLADIKLLEIPEDRVNVHGGAIALGHPIGASGTRVLVTLLHAMEHRNAKHGVATLCLGGGNAVAVCIRRP